MGSARKKIVIVGGGITGLSAAFYTRKLAEVRQIPVDITLVEKNERLGGQIQTLHRDGFVIEQGPDSFLARKLSAITLVKELGLEGELTATNPQAKTNYILHKLTLKRGLVALIDRLEESLQSIRIITGQGVVQLVSDGGSYKLKLEQGTSLQADGLILALPTFEAAKLISELPKARGLEQISYASVANIALAFGKADVACSLNGSGFVVPRKEGRMITACTWSSSKWQHVAPSGSILLRTYVGRSDSQEWVQMSDRQLLAGVRADLQETMGITAEPLFFEVNRCYRSMPQYPVGHGEHLMKLGAQLRNHKPGLFLCGAGYEGVGIPDCIRQGKGAAEQMLTFLATK